MTDDEFHVHGLHEHAVEPGAHTASGLNQYVAIFTALLATIGAIVGYNTAVTLNESMMYKNEAVLQKTAAADLWSYFQAQSEKGHLMELASELVTDANKLNGYREHIEKYNREKARTKQKAEALEGTAQQANETSILLLRPLHRFEQAITLIQIAISLASITALTRKRWLFACAGLAAAAGVSLAIGGFLA